MNNKSSNPTREAIAVRAYQLWEADNRPTGRDEIFWLRAEQQLRTERVPPIIPPPPLIPQSLPHSVPPVIREVAESVVRPPRPAPARKRGKR